MMWEIGGWKDLHILLRSYLHKIFWIAKVQNNSRAHLRNKSGFLKYSDSLLGNNHSIKPLILKKPVNWYPNQIYRVMFGVYSLSTTAEITFILPKLYLKKIDKKAITLFRLCLLLYVKNWVTVHHCFFHLSFPKVLHKSVILSIIKVPYKSAILSIITCHHLS